jgi:hypothetical protein
LYVLLKCTAACPLAGAHEAASLPTLKASLLFELNFDIIAFIPLTLTAHLGFDQLAIAGCAQLNE